MPGVFRRLAKKTQRRLAVVLVSLVATTLLAAAPALADEGAPADAIQGRSAAQLVPEYSADLIAIRCRPYADPQKSDGRRLIVNALIKSRCNIPVKSPAILLVAYDGKGKYFGSSWRDLQANTPLVPGALLHVMVSVPEDLLDPSCRVLRLRLLRPDGVEIPLRTSNGADSAVIPVSTIKPVKKP